MDMEPFKEVLAATASVSTILQFLTGVLICRNIVKRGSTGDISGFPFIAGFLGCALWLQYGLMLGDSAMIKVNVVGAGLQGSYLLVYHLYAFPRTTIQKQTLSAGVFLGLAILYSQLEPDFEKAKFWTGLISCSLTVIFCAAPLTQLGHVIQSGSTETLPFPMILATFLVCFQWFLYGLAIHDTFVQVPNFLGALLGGFQLSLFAYYPHDHKLQGQTDIC